MVNGKQLAILREGARDWNEWRGANPKIKPDLRNADLAYTDLDWVNLENANLEGANLVGANLENADLQGANLSETNLEGANLKYADFEGASLNDANLKGANLEGARFERALLFWVNLENANLSHANFHKSNLGFAYLKRVQALHTDFMGAILTGACIEDWNINTGTDLNDVICDYVYFRGSPNEIEDGENKAEHFKVNYKNEEDWSERRPHAGTFALGEFAKLVQSTLDTIDFIFREGMDWQAFAYSFKQAEALHQDAHLAIRDIGNRDDGVVIVKIASTPSVDKRQIYTDITQFYEASTKAISAQYEARLVDKDRHINQLFTLLQSSQERLGEVPKLMADLKSGDSYYGDIKAVNFTPRGTGMGGVYNDFSNTQDLAQATSQIQALLIQFQQQGQSLEASQQQIADDLAEQAKKDPTTLGKLVMWGQKLGDATVTDVVKGVVKMALKGVGVPLL